MTWQLGAEVNRARALQVREVLAAALTARGWTLQPVAQENSGLHGVRVAADGYTEGADPRREGVVRVVAPPAAAPSR